MGGSYLSSYSDGTERDIWAEVTLVATVMALKDIWAEVILVATMMALRGTYGRKLS
jgi:hypothetical protein